MNETSISAALATATCTLLGTGVPVAVAAQEEPSWDIHTSILYYGENDKRVQDVTLKAIIRRLFVDERVFSFGITIDGLTGASPSGAIRQDVPQTFTNASGNSSYTVAAGELPLDREFRDTRLALTANWQQPFAETNHINLGLSASKEYDYLHLGLNGRLARDFNKRNTTVSVGIAFARDASDPVGGVPLALSAVLDVGDFSNRTGGGDKNILDIVAGVAQVISANLVAQVNYSFSSESGYLNNPYKILSVVDGISGDTMVNIPGSEGPSHVFLFESRPDDRRKQSIYTQLKFYKDGKVIDASYRYMTDNWGIDSHTVDLRYRWPMAAGRFIEPHLRFYSQTAAEFYRLSLVDGAALPVYASSDFRLGKFDATTLGLKYAWKTRRDRDMSIRVELYRQSGTIPGSQHIGNQSGRDNYPDLNAIIVQFSYRFRK